MAPDHRLDFATLSEAAQTGTAGHAIYDVITPKRALPNLRSEGHWWMWRLPPALDLPLPRAGPLIAALRASLLAYAPQPVHPLISGHDQGMPLQLEHLAVLPLALVGLPHGDSRVRGVAASLPPDSEAERAMMHAIDAWERATRIKHHRGPLPLAELRFAGTRVLAERIVNPDDATQHLSAHRWAQPSTVWASATPIALDGECGPIGPPIDAQRRKAWKTAEKLIRRSAWYALAEEARAEVAGEQITVSITLDPPIIGGAPVQDHPRFQRAGHERPRRLVHAIVQFPRPVSGPLLLGAGRHFGLGLCVPMSDSVEASRAPRPSDAR